MMLVVLPKDPINNAVWKDPKANVVLQTVPQQSPNAPINNAVS
jgi:hypothetical protein